MASRKTRDFHCAIVNEPVKICLRSRSTAGVMGRPSLFVKCDQSECQHVDGNEPPCPLSLAMFTEEIREREDSARARRDEYPYR
jgi:hypothetical protein